MTDCQHNQPPGKNRQTLPNPHSVAEAQIGGAHAESKKHHMLGASDKKEMRATATPRTQPPARTNQSSRVGATTASPAPPQQCTTPTQRWQEQGVPHGSLKPKGRISPTMRLTTPAKQIAPCRSHSPQPPHDVHPRTSRTVGEATSCVRPRPLHRSHARMREAAISISATQMPHKRRRPASPGRRSEGREAHRAGARPPTPEYTSKPPSMVQVAQEHNAKGSTRATIHTRIAPTILIATPPHLAGNLTTPVGGTRMTTAPTKLTSMAKNGCWVYTVTSLAPVQLQRGWMATS